MPFLCAAQAPAADYRRSARKLRCQLAGNPAAMHGALAALAKHTDATRAVQLEHESTGEDTATVHVRRIAAEPVAVNEGVRDFARAVAVELEGPVLRYSRRQVLLKQAESIGIGRFDANLIIAAVQHRMGSEKTLTRSASSRSWSLQTLTIVTCVSVVQAMIFAGAWHIFK